MNRITTTPTPILTLSTAILLSLLGCSNSGIGPEGIKPLAYYITDTIPGGVGTTGGEVRTRSDQETIFVAAFAVAYRNFIPSEECYQLLKQKQHTLPDRERLFLVEARRLKLLLPDGQEREADFVGYWDPAAMKPIAGFAPGALQISLPAGAAAPEIKHIAVAWALPKASIGPTPALRVKLDSNMPIMASQRKIDPPKVEPLRF